jgi:hypothetical protein
MGALKTLGRGWLASPALPSAEMMETVGLLVILAVVDCSSLSSIQRRKIESLKSLQKSGGATSRLAQPKILALSGHSFAHSFTQSSASWYRIILCWKSEHARRLHYEMIPMKYEP